ncbi:MULTISPECIES: SDR family oxidoreductase [unclassified Curtobacterium]|uniref:SDR family oxidoreductase n=1 Tax=unclassified Curtobacterium TaxID=257496 RepID=UPI0008DC70CC|nr:MULTISPECIES: SDR family oxidoreductase [unclassified Curtobacterium]OIH99548.1 short-chain dehydrogenase [Curtobacterium sp. MCBA15_003]OII30617.1 short-chain dehydrogenase [Curtobacterium sp. MMLR14_006]
MTEEFTDRTVLVTGANGGLGTEFVRQALERGARRVYAAARSPRTWDDERVVPIALDVTDPSSIAAAVATASDVDLLVNNAGIAPEADASLVSVADDTLEHVFATNTFGVIRVSAAFAPVLAANGGGAVLNVLSLAAWIPLPTVYAASKAAALAATNGLRTELAGQGTAVTGLIVGMIDTAMGARFDVPKSTPEHVVTQAYDGVAAGAWEVLADDDSRFVKGLLSAPAEDLAAATRAAMEAVVD